MPYRRKRYRRYSVRGRTASAAMRQRGFTTTYNRFFRRSGGTLSNGRYKLRGIVEIASSGTGTINNAIRLTQPDDFDGASNALTDWTNFANLYDQFRVTYVKIRWTPAVPNDSSATTLYSPIYVFTDFDSIGLNPTNATTVGYGNLKVKNAYQPWTYGIRIPKLINTGATNVSIPGFMDTLAPEATGAIYMINSNAGQFSNSKRYGELLITYWVKGVQRR